MLKPERGAAWKEGGGDRGGRTTDNKWLLLLEPLHQFTMDSVMASRCLDIFVVWSLLPLLIYTSRIIKDTPGLQSNGKASVCCAPVRCLRGTALDELFPLTTHFTFLIKYKQLVILWMLKKKVTVMLSKEK